MPKNENPYNELRKVLFRYMEQKKGIIFWTEDFKKYLRHTRHNVDLFDDNFFNREVKNGFLQIYQDGYRFSKKGLAVYKKILYGKIHNKDTKTKIKEVLETLDDGLGLNCSTIAETLDCSPDTIQRHLREMEKDGMVVIVKDGRPKTYTLAGQKHLF